jgi:RNA methyltransferase, TrmH family
VLSQNQLKFLTGLHAKKQRQKYRNFLLEGSKIVSELLAQDRFGVVHIFCTEQWATEHTVGLASFSEKITLVTEADLRKAGTLVTPNQVIAVAAYPAAMPVVPSPAASLHLYLDGLQDPGNVGTILRIADWFGVAAVHCSPDCADAFSPKVLSAGMGACLRVPIFEDVQLFDFQKDTPHVPLIGALLDGQNVFEKKDLPRTGVLVIGNEGRGIRAEHLPLLTHRLRIPGGGSAESLNASVAAGILVAQLLARPVV